VFRVTAAQLAARGGLVRCGRCHRIFDGTASVYTAVAPAAVAEVAEATTAPPDVVAQDNAALAHNQMPDAASEMPEAASVSVSRPRRWTLLFALAIPVLVALLAAQAAFHFRDDIASHWPQTSPVLTRMCEILGCTLQPLHEIGYLSIEASDLQADPAHKGLLILSVTVRNRAPYALAYPYLELTLTDAQDQPVVRRALAPKDYAGGTADLDAGIAGNAELPVKVFIDASASSQVGYRVYLFYP
jgi:predicted Zn finger-like uncharacterized protein